MRTTYFQAPFWATGMMLISAAVAQTPPPAEAPPRPPVVPEMLSPAVTGQFQPLAPAAPSVAPAGPNANHSAANPAAGNTGGGVAPGASLMTAPAQVQAPAAPPPLPEGCRPVTERAMSIEAQTLTAIAQQKPLAEQSVLVEEAIALWTKAGAQCEGRLQDRAQRNLQENIKLQQRLKEQSASGPKCEPAHRDAASIQDLAAKALDEGRFPEATRLFQKAEDAWDHAAESCTGTQHDVALKRREQSEIDGHNAEFCAPAFESAREQHQKLANLPVSVPRPERQELSQTAETLWRDAMKLCKGEVIEAAKRNAQNIARERNTPWVPRSQIPTATLALIEKRNAPPAPPAAATSSASTSKALAAAPSAPGNTGGKLATGTPDATKANPASTPSSAGAVAGTLSSALNSLGSAVSTLGATALNANKASAAAAAASAAPPTDVSSGAKAKTPEQQPPEFTSANASFRGNFVRDAEGNSFSGAGKVTWTNGDVFEGNLDKGLRQGKGRFVWANGQSFEGDWVKDTPNGKGTLKFANGNVFEGDVVAGVPQGTGRMQYVSGDSYQGAITAGVPNGKGIYTWKNGQVFEGDWKAERPNGQGRLKFANGNVFEGTVVDGVPHGTGKLVFAAGDTYAGEVNAGQPDGTGTFNWTNGDQYAGQWKDGKKHGQGVFTWKTGDRWEGVFENDVQR